MIPNAITPSTQPAPDSFTVRIYNGRRRIVSKVVSSIDFAHKFIDRQFAMLGEGSAAYIRNHFGNIVEIREAK